MSHVVVLVVCEQGYILFRYCVPGRTPSRVCAQRTLLLLVAAAYISLLLLPLYTRIEKYYVHVVLQWL